VFVPPECKISAHEKPSQRRNWAPCDQPGYSLVPAMHHYRCQNIYIISTESECIVDTLNFFPHNYLMPQLSPTDRILMAANDMNDALKHHHPDVTFNRVGDDTKKALATLSAIFKNNYNKPPVPELIDSPIKDAENKSPAVLIQPVLTSPVKHNSQTRSQTEANQVPAHFIESPKSPQLPRMVTPATRSETSPRLPTRARNLSPRNLSQGDSCDLGSANNAII
jgi:hypothetical protein